MCINGAPPVFIYVLTCVLSPNGMEQSAVRNGGLSLIRSLARSPKLNRAYAVREYVTNNHKKIKNHVPLHTRLFFRSPWCSQNVAIRMQDKTLPLGYNIVAGKMSYEISKILNPNSFAPTLVAMDINRLRVVDQGGLRKLSLKEGLDDFGLLFYRCLLQHYDPGIFLGLACQFPLLDVSKALKQRLSKGI